MSCFGGRMREYRFLSIDRFDGDNLLSRMFFLSHCHEDHMTGLDNKRFVNYLAANNLRLYVHEISAHILINTGKYSHLKPYLVELPVYEPIMLDVPKDSIVNGQEMDTITVTLLPAGHCPGSVMFLFEGSEGTVLYTGDIRLTGEDLENMPALKSGEQVKTIKSIYFDSTFCTFDTIKIVDRKESLRAILNLARPHLRESPNHKVLLFCHQKYGHEFLMWRLSQELKMQIHVTESKRALYEKIPEIRPWITADGTKTRLHACAFYLKEDDEIKLNGRRPGNEPKYHGRRSAYSIPCCPECRSWDPNVLIIKPSMIWFQQSRSVSDTIYYDENAGGIYRVQYSCHSSLSEIRELLRYLQPQNAYPNVVPVRSKDYAPVYRAIRDLVPSIAECSPRKFDSNIRLTSGQAVPSGVEIERCDEKRTGFVSNFANRKRYMESVLAKQKWNFLDDNPAKRRKKEKPAPSTWEACLQSDSDCDSSQCDSSSEDENGYQTSDSDSSVDVVEDSENDKSLEQKKNEPSTSAAACPGPSVAPECVEIDIDPTTPGSKAASVEIVDEDPDDDLVLRLSGCSDQSPRKDDEVDSDVDLFAPIDRSVSDDDDEVEVIEKEEENVSMERSTPKDSLEFLGTFNKNENPPVITIYSQEEDFSLPNGQESEISKAVTEERNSSNVVAIERMNSWINEGPSQAQKVNYAPTSDNDVSIARKYLDDVDEAIIIDDSAASTEKTPKMTKYDAATPKRSTGVMATTKTSTCIETTPKPITCTTRVTPKTTKIDKMSGTNADREETPANKTETRTRRSSKSEEAAATTTGSRSATKPKNDAATKKDTTLKKPRKKRERLPSPASLWMRHIIEDDEEDRAFLLAGRCSKLAVPKNGEEDTKVVK